MIGNRQKLRALLDEMKRPIPEPFIEAADIQVIQAWIIDRERLHYLLEETIAALEQEDAEDEAPCWLITMGYFSHGPDPKYTTITHKGPLHTLVGSLDDKDGTHKVFKNQWIVSAVSIDEETYRRFGTDWSMAQTEA